LAGAGYSACGGEAGATGELYAGGGVRGRVFGGFSGYAGSESDSEGEAGAIGGGVGTDACEKNKNC
jgi:hypothetical protein